jgi:hypothetical protein
MNGSNLSLFLMRMDSNNPAAPINQGGIGDIVGLFRMVRIFCDGDSPNMVNWLLAHDPNVIISLRNMRVLEDPFDAMPRTPANAIKLWASFKEYRKAIIDPTRVVFCLPPNEPGMDTDAERAELDAWWAALAAEAQADHKHIGMLNASAEARFWDKWQSFPNMLAAAHAGGHWLDLHGYAPGPNILDSTYAEFLMPWRELISEFAKAGRTDLAGLRIMAGEYGEDHNILHQTGTSGYRLSISNEAYAQQLAATMPRLAADNVDAFIFAVAASDYTGKTDGDTSPGSIVDYNINIGSGPSGSSKKGNYNPGDPSVWDRLRPIMAAATGGGPIEIPPPVVTPPPPVTPPPISGPSNGRVIVIPGQGVTPNLRLTPEARADNTNLLAPNVAVDTPVVLTGLTVNGYAQVGVTLALNDQGPELHIKGWLLSAGVKVVS